MSTFCQLLLLLSYQYTVLYIYVLLNHPYMADCVALGRPALQSRTMAVPINRIQSQMRCIASQLWWPFKIRSWTRAKVALPRVSQTSLIPTETSIRTMHAGHQVRHTHTRMANNSDDKIICLIQVIFKYKADQSVCLYALSNSSADATVFNCF